MAFHNSLVLVTGGEDATAVEAALMLAEQSRGHVTGLHVTGDVTQNIPSIVEGMSERQIAKEFQAMKDRVADAEGAAREVFTSACARHGVALVDEARPGDGVTATWRVAPGRPDQVMSQKARVYDVLVGNAAGDRALHAVENGLFDAGRPVLVVPRETPKSLGKHILIGWNRTANASRAVMAAMPLIKDAETVTICHVTTGAKPGPSPEELAEGLAWHGVKAVVRHIPDGGAAVSDLLMTEAANIGGDLVVMGAYSHSRMREFVLGGVTRHALRHVVTPLLMMH